jgi:hypothetical protein
MFGMLKKNIKNCIKKMSSNDYLLTILRNEEECVFIIEFDLTPLRLQLTRSSEDDFFTIVLAYKLTPEIKNKTDISKQRYYVAMNCYKTGIGFLALNSYETHKPIGTWDEKQIENEPYESFDKRKTLNFFKEELPKLMADYKDIFAEKESGKRNNISNASSPSPAAAPARKKRKAKSVKDGNSPPPKNLTSNRSADVVDASADTADASADTADASADRSSSPSANDVNEGGV